MKRYQLIAAALALAAVPAAPALAGWKLAVQNAPVAIAKSKLTVTPAEQWNRSSVRPIRNSETWTIDGARLNELYFVSGLLPGQPLYREADKKNRPLPKLGAAMQLTDIPEFVESSMRVRLNTSVFRVTGVEPAKFLGRDGVRFTYEYAAAGTTLTIKGLAAATLVGNQLHLITFNAPAVYYFDRDRPKAEAIIASARL
jgi:hypothetical protein